MDKFIDLGVDDNHSAFGEGMAGRQQKFKNHLEKMQFTFETTLLDKPTGNDSAEAELQNELDEDIMTADTAMGADLDEMFNILTVQAQAELGTTSVIVEHKWDGQNKRFL